MLGGSGAVARDSMWTLEAKPELARKVRRWRRGGERARKSSGPGGAGWRDRRPAPQVTGGDRPLLRLGAAGWPQGARGTEAPGRGWAGLGGAEARPENGRMGPGNQRGLP